eukprot:6879968-Alexandrium_andersonii.AAC.1
MSRATGPLRPWSCCLVKGPGCAAAVLRSEASEGGRTASSARAGRPSLDHASAHDNIVNHLLAQVRGALVQAQLGTPWAQGHTAWRAHRQ